MDGQCLPRTQMIDILLRVTSDIISRQDIELTKLPWAAQGHVWKARV